MVVGIGGVVELVPVKFGVRNGPVDELVDVVIVADECIRRRRYWRFVAPLVASGDLHPEIKWV
jgi:hypothetical protein